MKLGIWGGRSDSRGLARQTESFARFLSPTRVMGFDLTAEDLSPYPTDWAPFVDTDALLDVKLRREITEDLARSWLRGLDVVLGAETFYHPDFCDWARAEGVRTILQINPEFAPWWNAQLRHPPPSRPDVFIAPTTWLLDKMPDEVIHLPCPVDRTQFPFRLRTRADHFVHTAGHAAMADRAGTRFVYGLAPRLRNSSIRVTIRSQSPLENFGHHQRYSSITAEVGSLPNPADLYADADVVLLPRRYGGQHLGANEALSSGCPVIMLNREPENTWGGVVPVPCRVRQNFRTQFGLIARYDTNSQTLLQVMNELHNNPARVQQLSEQADEYARSISWDTLLPRYSELLAQVAMGSLPI